MLHKIIALLSALSVLVQATDVQITTATPCIITVADENNTVIYTIIMEENGMLTTTFPVADEDPWSRLVSFILKDCDGCPATVVELNHLGENNYTYDISLVDGFTRQAAVRPLSGDVCQEVACLTNINEICPPDYQVLLSNGTVAACAPDPSLFEEVCPDTITTTDDSTNIIACNETGYVIEFF